MNGQVTLELASGSWDDFGAGNPRTIGEAIGAIRRTALTESEKGTRFETLVRQVLPTLPEYEMRKVWRFGDWPERETRMGRDRSDLGIDLVAELNSGEFVAIQCKFWGEHRKLSYKDLATFFADGAPIKERNHEFACLMVIATCPLTGAAQQQLRGRNGRHISFYHKHRDDRLDYKGIKRPHRPLPKQDVAIQSCVKGLRNHDRGRLIMACGTGKTFTALRIAEALGANSVLFVAPSIALVGQARKEWLRQAVGEIASVIVCSDSSAGRSGDDELGLLELDCPVTRNSGVVSEFLARDGDAMRVVFCTHQSLRRVTDAQATHGAGPFDLTIVDEAHWTTGIVKDKPRKKGGFSFQDVHFDEFVETRKRLYMTATPRVYTAKSKRSMETKGYVVHDMEDEEIYGPEFFRLNFRDAVESPGVDGRPMLCDYRVVVLTVPEGDVSPAMKTRLSNMPEATPKSINKSGLERHITRVYGTSLALNGEVEGSSDELPDRLRRVIAFSNTRNTSKWYARALVDSKVRERTTRALRDASRAGAINAEHLDAKNDAFSRSVALDRLRRVPADEPVSEVLCNVKLFSEGVDVPSLDAVVFLEPRNSQVDVVQAVGRVMRRGPDKSLGYIVVPVVVPEGATTLDALERGSDGYKLIGQVLRALQSHDGRLAEETARLVIVAQPTPNGGGGGGSGGGDGNGGGGGNGSNGGNGETGELFAEAELDTIREGILARIVESSGLGSAGQINAEDIRYAVDRAGMSFHAAGAAEVLASALGETFEGDGKSARNICKIGALLVANACLLHKRLSSLAHLSLDGLEGVGSAVDPEAALRADWERILERDYRPVFGPALNVLDALPAEDGVKRGLRLLVSCANAVADSLSELGYDHAGPLYHRILDTAASDGAFYTTNTAALLLAELALPPDLLNWQNPDNISKLRIIDPACGTGTLLMAALKTIKERALDGHSELEAARSAGPLHKDLVENAICGLDINHQAVQLAASNLTLGAPDVDYSRMNVYSMAHGVHPGGKVSAGSLELLAGQALAIESANTNTVRDAGGEQIDGSAIEYDPKGAFDLVIMNPPFTSNPKRGAKYSYDFKTKMRQREQVICREIEERQGAEAAALIDYNSVRTFFTPLADHLVRGEGGTLAKVMPVTACTSASGLAERQYLASKFHIDTLVTCHAKSRFAFSARTSIHECLMVCRRRTNDTMPPTRIVVLKRNPANADEVAELVRALRGEGDLSSWGNEHECDAKRIVKGDWASVQWFDGVLAEVARDLDANEFLEPAGFRHEIGPDGRRIQDACEIVDNEVAAAVSGFHSVSSKLRRKMLGEPDVWYRPRANKKSLAERYIERRNHLLVPMRFDTISGRLSGLWTESPSFGWWVPMSVDEEQKAKALAAWWNATPARLMLLNRRGRKLTYPVWQVAHLREIGVPRPENSAWDALKEAFDSVCNRELLPMRQGNECVVRQVIDEAAALVIGVEPEVVADWRARLAREPTVGAQ